MSTTEEILAHVNTYKSKLKFSSGLNAFMVGVNLKDPPVYYNEQPCYGILSRSKKELVGANYFYTKNSRNTDSSFYELLSHLANKSRPYAGMILNTDLESLKEGVVISTDYPANLVINLATVCRLGWENATVRRAWKVLVDGGLDPDAAILFAYASTGVTSMSISFGSRHSNHGTYSAGCLMEENIRAFLLKNYTKGLNSKPFREFSGYSSANSWRGTSGEYGDGNGVAGALLPKPKGFNESDSQLDPNMVKLIKSFTEVTHSEYQYHFSKAIKAWYAASCIGKETGVNVNLRDIPKLQTLVEHILSKKDQADAA